MKEILGWIYGIAGMIVFFAFLFYGGNVIIALIDYWYLLVLLGLPVVFIFWLWEKFIKKQ